MLNYFESSNLLYKPVTLSDAKLILKWRNSTEVKSNFIIQDDITEEDNKNWYDNVVSKGKAVQFVVYVIETHQPIGSVYFSHVDKMKSSAEYGIFIGVESAKGKGYGTEIIKWAVNYAKNKMKMKYLYLRVFEDNKAAIKSYINGGFVTTDKYEIINQNGYDRKLIFMENNIEK